MLTAEMERQSCLSSAEQWRRQAEQVREHAGRSYLQPRQREALLAEADAWVDSSGRRNTGGAGGLRWRVGGARIELYRES